MTSNKAWERFFNEKILKIFSEKKDIVDIGGGLRVLREKNNRYDRTKEWIRPLLKKVNYKILDPVPDFNPDIIGDIHNLPLKDNSLDAFLCIAVLEHVEDPLRACREMHRVLKPGGYCFVYIPFLYYYHAEGGYYKDYWRFTKDSVPLLFCDFSSVEIVSVRGAVQTWLRNSPLGRYKIVEKAGFILDRLFGKDSSDQVSGYNIFLIK
jgi:SAM-dependent methyltransferase